MYVIGIDEAGRGALAGPVVVGVVSVKKGFNPRVKNLPKLRDSKVLSSIEREAWYEFIKNHPEIFYSSARMYPSSIDRKNISWAANNCASNAFDRLIRDYSPKYSEVLLDGSLYLGNKNHENIPAKTIIRGDERVNVIALASIVAKVTRDNYMTKIHDRYPKYEFATHKGYGTKLHRNSIKKHGACDIHRQSFRL